MRLTDISVRNLTPPENGQADYRDDSLRGFMCRVSQGGTKTFVLVHGKDRRRTSLGRYPLISLADARGEAKRILAEHTLGKHQAPRQTFKGALDAFLANHEANNRPGTTSEVRRILTKQFASLHRHQLAEVRTHDLTRITDRMMESGHPSAANHAHMAVRSFLHWCVRRRLLQHSPLEGLERPATIASRERILTDDELVTVWGAADAIGGHFSAIVKLLILTGQRRSEIGSLRDTYITDHSVCLPKEITKNGRSHTFPIGTLSAAILPSNIGAGTTSIFPARGKPDQSFNGWSKAKLLLDQKTKIAPWTLHDLRRTFATGLQRLGVRIEVIERNYSPPINST
jgi:integrase